MIAIRIRRFRSFPFMIFLVLVSYLQIPAQNTNRPLTTKVKKAEKLFYDASDAYQIKQFDRALYDLDQALHFDSLFIEAVILKGDILSDMSRSLEAIRAYRKALTINPDFSPNLYYIVGNLEYSNGLYKESRQDLQQFASHERIQGTIKENTLKKIRACDFAIRAIENPVPFKPINLGDSINSVFDEYINAITADDRILYFTRKYMKNYETGERHKSFEEDFFYSVRINDSTWRKAVNLGPPINTSGNEGALTISPDGRYLFFAACNRPEGFGSCDLYWSEKMGHQWSDPVNLGPVVNSGGWDSQPSFSSDGKTLYFASKRPGGKGSSDIWKTTLEPDGQWSFPENLGDSINTPYEEQTPFIHPDDQTLYFSSKGFEGMGGYDLFISRKNADNSWSKAINLGYPINTFADELSLIVDAKGEMAYISSDKFGGKGKQDIYRFKIYEKAKPFPVNYFKGIVFNGETGEKLEAEFELIDLKTGKTVARAASDRFTGEFLLILPVQKEYALNISKPGYLFYSDHFSLTGDHSIVLPFIKNVPLQPIQIGKTVVMKNIFFDTDQFVLKEESQAELHRLIQLLNQNPKIMIEISGHTDNVGTPLYNLELSMNRAKAVYDYLLSHGIGKQRMTYTGYGLTKPIDTNETEQGRASNRRTEFKITGK